MSWTPAEIATSLWLDGSDSATCSASLWQDKSGNGRDFSQSTSSYQPVYTAAAVNGLNALRFDGTNDFLDGNTAAKALFQGVTSGILCAAVSRTGGNTSSTVFLASTNSSATTPRIALFANASAAVSQYRAPDTASTVSVSLTHSGTAGLAEAIWNFKETGFVVTGWTGDQGGGTQPQVATSATASNVCRIGAYSAASNRFAGYICEIVVVPEYSYDAMTRVEGYLAWKWGFQASLPSWHDYYYAPPASAGAVAAAPAVTVPLVIALPTTALGSSAPAITLPLSLAAPGTQSWVYAPALQLGLSLPLPTAIMLGHLPVDYSRYRVTVGQIEVVASAFQCSRRLGESTWLSVSVPRWSTALESALLAAVGEPLSVAVGDGENWLALLDAVLTAVDSERTGSSGSLSLTGRVQTPSYSQQTRTLPAVIRRTVENGRTEVYCATVDPLIRPNDVMLDGIDQWTVGAISYRISPSACSMRILEAASG